jgi:hypothetical protein
MRSRYLILLGASLLLALGIKERWWYIFSRPKPIKIEALSGEFDSTEKKAVFNNQTLSILPEEEGAPLEAVVLGKTVGEKRIEIDLTNQKLYAFAGDQLLYSFAVSTGKWARTPTGKFEIWTKLRYSKMEGGSKTLHTYYYLPNVPYVMYFFNQETPKSRGYGIHGTYWHDNFGHPMSHGCINMRTSEAKLVYYWADPELRNGQSIFASQDNPGTPIIIYGTAPKD